MYKFMLCLARRQASGAHRGCSNRINIPAAPSLWFQQWNKHTQQKLIFFLSLCSVQASREDKPLLTLLNRQIALFMCRNQKFYDAKIIGIYMIHHRTLEKGERSRTFSKYSRLSYAKKRFQAHEAATISLSWKDD